MTKFQKSWLTLAAMAACLVAFVITREQLLLSPIFFLAGVLGAIGWSRSGNEKRPY